MIGILGALAASRRAGLVVVAVWVALAAALAPLVVKLPEVTVNETTGFLPSGSESSRVGRILAERFPNGETTSALLVYRRDGGLAPADRRAIVTQAREAADAPHAGRPFAPFGPGARRELVSPDGAVAFTLVPVLSTDQEEAAATVDFLREMAEPAPPGLEVEVTGRAAVDTDMNSAFESGDAPLLIVTGLLVLALLVVIYRSPVIALVPLVVVGVAYTVAGGIVYLLADSGLEVSSISTSLLLVLMFGAGTDYCLLLVARWVEDLWHTEDGRVALRKAILKTGAAIVASAFTVMVALLALVVAQVGSTRTMGPVTAIGVAVVLVASLTLLPALLGMVGRRGFWPSRRLVAYEPELPRVGSLPSLPAIQLAEEHPSLRRQGIWRRVGVRVLERPVPALAGVVALLAAGAVGLTLYHEQADILKVFREENGSTRGQELLQSGFPAGTLAPTTVLVERTGGPIRPRDVEAARVRVSSLSGVGAVTTVTSRSTDGRIATFDVVFSDDPYSNPALERVEHMRERLDGLGPGLQALVGSGSAIQLDYREAANRDLKVIVPVVLFVIFLTLVALLRALVAPLFLIGSVILSFFGILGISLAIWHFLLGESDFDASFPTFAFVFLVALGVDYNIFLMDRVREEARKEGTRKGLLRAFIATGPVITSAGIILAGTFAVLLTMPITILAEVGLTVALGVLIDTFLVRSVMVPAITQLLGDRSWWPSRLTRPPHTV